MRACAGSPRDGPRRKRRHGALKVGGSSVSHTARKHMAQLKRVRETMGNVTPLGTKKRHPEGPLLSLHGPPVWPPDGHGSHVPGQRNTPATKTSWPRPRGGSVLPPPGFFPSPPSLFSSELAAIYAVQRCFLPCRHCPLVHLTRLLPLFTWPGEQREGTCHRGERPWIKGGPFQLCHVHASSFWARRHDALGTFVGTHTVQPLT